MRAYALLMLGQILNYRGNLDCSREVLEEALALAQQSQEPLVSIEAVINFRLPGNISTRLGGKRRSLQRALDQSKDLGNSYFIGLTLVALAADAFAQRNFARAASLEAEAIDRIEAAGDVQLAARVNFGLASCYFELGDLAHSIKLVCSSLQIGLTLQDRSILFVGVQTALTYIGESGDPLLRASLIGAAVALSQATGASLAPYVGESYLRDLRDRFISQDEHAAFRQGRVAPPCRNCRFGDATIGGMVQLPAQPEMAQEAAQPSPNDHTLSARELEVLRLVAQGLSNKAIARQLVITPSTVNYHLASIFKKLGVETRAQAVAVAAQQGLIS